MERLLLPIDTLQDELPEVTILQWHVEEGASLKRGLPLATVLVGTQPFLCFFRRKGHGLVIKKRAVLAGERMAAYETLALIGESNESLSDSMDISEFPLFGISSSIERSRKYYRTFFIILLCAIFLVVVQTGVNMWLHYAVLPKPGVLILLKEYLTVVFPIAFGCLFMPLVVVMGILVMLHHPGEPEEGIRLRRLPVLSRE